MRNAALAVACALLAATALSAQPRVDSLNLHERAIIVVPITGAGTYRDPKRPLLAPPPGTRVPGLISFQWEPSDDGKLAIVEYVAQTKAVLRPFLTDARVVKSFEKGKDKAADIERELKKYRKDYRFDKRGKAK